jgi:pyruvate kinase
MTQRPTTRDELLHDAEQLLMNAGIVEKGDFIVLTAGDPMGTSGGTNTLKIVRVGDQQPYKV